jgi:hypothetical protein
MTIEPPKGLRNNLLRTYNNLNDKVYKFIIGIEWLQKTTNIQETLVLFVFVSCYYFR